MANEIRVLCTAIELKTNGEDRFHGYQLVSTLAEVEGSPALMNQSTLYRALRRLEERGAVESYWEDPETAAREGREGRPRRYYQVTPSGVALARTELSKGSARNLQPGWGPARG